MNSAKTHTSLWYRCWTCCIFVSITLVSFSQSVPFSKEAFYDKREELKEAQNNIKDGDANNELENYYLALNFYLKANEFNPNNAELNYKIGLCYLNSELRFKSLNYFAKAFQLQRDIATDIHLMLGRGFHLNSDFESAINEYKAYLLTISAEELITEQAIIDKLISECETGRTFTDKEQRAFADNMGLEINSSFNDHSPLITADESNLIFTSTRNNGSKIKTDGHYDEDIYISYKSGKKWVAR